MQGQGIPSQIQILELFTSNIDFPPTSIGDTSIINLPIFNSGSETLNILGLNYDENIFFSSFSSSSIEPGQTINIPIYFSPINDTNYENIQLEIISDSYGGSASTYLTLNGQGYHEIFNAVPSSGLPYTIILENINTGDIVLSDGDQFGIFDGELIVGSMYVSGDTVSGIAWRNDLINGLIGFSNGNPITIRYFNLESGNIYDLNYTIIQGDGNFGTPPYSVLSPEILPLPLDIESIQEISNITILEDSGPNIIEFDIFSTLVLLLAHYSIYLLVLIQLNYPF